MPKAKKRGRQSLKPAPGFGVIVYELMVRRRTKEGTIWQAEDLWRALKATGSKVSTKTVRDWIGKGIAPRDPETYVLLSKVLGVPVGPLVWLASGRHISHKSAPGGAKTIQGVTGAGKFFSALLESAKEVELRSAFDIGRDIRDSRGGSNGS